MATKKIIGRRNTVIKAIPKPLFKMMVQIQMELQNKRKGIQKVTLLEAGVELARRAKNE